LDDTGPIYTFAENGVVDTDFSILDGSSTVALDFDTMTDTQVLAALNADATFGSSAAGGNFVGTVQNSILFVENNDAPNAGEYKVYQVTSGTAVGDANFTSATLVGTLDFGETQDFDVANFA
jgi:hypothetical protein